MEKLPAITGWIWLKQAIALFRKQPLEMSTLFLACLFLMLVIDIVPVLGQLLTIVLMPMFSMTFMQACLHIEQGKKVTPALLLYGLKLPSRRKLLLLGALYLLTATLAIGASALVDGGQLWRILSSTQQASAEAMQGTNLSQSVLLSGLVSIPALMAFWYAAPLVGWRGMSVGRALFYSFFAVKRNGKAFVVFGLAWLVISGFLPVFIGGLVTLLLGKIIAISVVMLLLLFLLPLIMWCSFYPTYTSVFPLPEQA
jgi:hypothetical protein